ncbi:MAG: recombination protein RecR [Bacteroidales bacterium]|nr:recombination protein RecR [Bacteroidales bacterium]
MYSEKRDFSSKLLDEAVDSFASLPGVGRKTALRLALHLLDEDVANVERFASSLLNMRRNIRYCPECHMLSDDGLCPICSNPKRDHSIICVVESYRDIISIERTGQYNGLYHLLGGIISPIDGIGPSDLTIDLLKERVAKGDVKEILLAISTSMEGETTAFYIYRQLAEFQVHITAIARGVGFGDDLEYTDELTLGKSIINRQPFQP